MLNYLDNIIQAIRRTISPVAKIFVNIRDLMASWASPRSLNARERLLTVVEHLASMKHKIYGLMFEEPSGDAFHWDYSKPVTVLRQIMVANGWADGHFLVHVHKKYGLGDAAMLEVIACGGDGVWGAASPSGAGVGHACSLVALTNLARLGNPHVAEMCVNCRCLHIFTQ